MISYKWWVLQQSDRSNNNYKRDGMLIINDNITSWNNEDSKEYCWWNIKHNEIRKKVYDGGYIHEYHWPSYESKYESKWPD